MQKKRNQGGFTLIELAIVLVILGVIIYIVSNFVRGSSDPANATAIRAAAKNMANAIGYTSTNLGTGISATSNSLPASGLTMMDVLMVGDTAVNASYLNAFKQLKMRPLEGDYKVITRPSGSTPGTYQLINYPVTFVPCTTGKVCVQFQNVPSDTVAELALKSGITNFAAGTAQATGALQYTAVDSNGFHTVTLQAVP